jgi:hypothetical protein
MAPPFPGGITVEEQANKVEAQAKEISELKSALKEVTARLDAKAL